MEVKREGKEQLSPETKRGTVTKDSSLKAFSDIPLETNKAHPWAI